MNVFHPNSKTVTIPINTALSNAIDLTKTDGQTVVAIVTPAAWTAAGLAFKVSVDNVTYVPLYDGRDPTTPVEYGFAAAGIPVAEARAFALDVGVFAGFNYVKIVSGTNASGVNQAAARTLYVQTRRV